VATLGDELRCVVALSAPPSYATPGGSDLLQHHQRRSAIRTAAGFQQLGFPDEPIAVLHQQMGTEWIISGLATNRPGLGRLAAFGFEKRIGLQHLRIVVSEDQTLPRTGQGSVHFVGR
jgi:hypothetical protein